MASSLKVRWSNTADETSRDNIILFCQPMASFRGRSVLAMPAHADPAIGLLRTASSVRRFIHSLGAVWRRGRESRWVSWRVTEAFRGALHHRFESVRSAYRRCCSAGRR